MLLGMRMKQFTACCLLTLPLALLPGCDSAAPPPAAAAPTPSASAPAAVAEKSASPKPAAAKPVRRERAPAERAKISQLFQVPQVTRSNAANYGETRQEGSSAPQIRLLGFSLLDGVQRALVEVKGEVLQVEQGDVIDGAEVVAIDADGISFQFSGSRWTELLFEKQQNRPVVVARAAAAVVAPSSGTEPSPGPVN